MLQSIRLGTRDSQQPFRVGVNDSLPKSLAYELLAPVFRHMPQTALVCLEGTQNKLLADLAAHEIDVVLSDSPFDHSVKVVAFNHYLGSSGTSFFAHPKLARRAREFPKALTHLPLLLPWTGTPQRKAIDRWFVEQGILPRVLGEFEDSALMKTFGREGAGIFVGPTSIERTICSHYGVSVVGRAPKAQIDIFVITVDRKVRHPAVSHLCGSARHDLLTNSGKRRRE
jgi:LysR family transcriptional activator of nhaA